MGAFFQIFMLLFLLHVYSICVSVQSGVCLFGSGGQVGTGERCVINGDVVNDSFRKGSFDYIPFHREQKGNV